MKKHVKEWIEKEIKGWGDIETIKKTKNGFIQAGVEVIWEEKVYQRTIDILKNCNEISCYSVIRDNKEKRYYIDFYWKNKEYRFHFGYDQKEKELDWNFFSIKEFEEMHELEKEELDFLKGKVRKLLFVFIHMPKFRVRYAIKPIKIP